MIHVQHPYDLRQPLEVKLEDCHSHASITVLLNRNRNLAHVFFKGEQEAYLRLRVPRAQLFGTSDFWVEKWFSTRLQRWL